MGISNVKFGVFKSNLLIDNIYLRILTFVAFPLEINNYRLNYRVKNLICFIIKF